MNKFVMRLLLLVCFFTLALLSVSAVAEHGLRNASKHANENANLPDLPAVAVDHAEPNDRANEPNGDNGNQENSDSLNHGQCVSATAHKTEPPKGEAVSAVAQNQDLVGPDCIVDGSSSTESSNGTETSEAAKSGGREFGQAKKAENAPGN